MSNAFQRGDIADQYTAGDSFFWQSHNMIVFQKVGFKTYLAIDKNTNELYRVNFVFGRGKYEFLGYMVNPPRLSKHLWFQKKVWFLKMLWCWNFGKIVRMKG